MYTSRHICREFPAGLGRTNLVHAKHNTLFSTLAKPLPLQRLIIIGLLLHQTTIIRPKLW